MYRPQWLADIVFAQQLKRALRMLKLRGCTLSILYIWRPRFAPALRFIPYDLSCYYIDDEYTFSPVDLPIDARERTLIEDVDQVFIHSPGLLEKKGGINPNTAFVPNGVDYEAFSQPAPEPRDLAAIPRPRIGYIGRIKRTLDWDLIEVLTRQHPEWSFVMIGLVKHSELETRIEVLSNRQNVFFLGPKPSKEIAAYPQHFDVCIMPYRNDDYAKYGYPLKLHEYLASGRPAVGTRMRTLEDFDDVVALPSTMEEWSKAIKDALTPAANTPECRAVRQSVARKHDWDLLVERIATTLADRLGHTLPPPRRNEA